MEITLNIKAFILVYRTKKLFEVNLHDIRKKKLVTRLPNFPDRMIMYKSFLLKNIVTNKKIFGIF